MCLCLCMCVEYTWFLCKMHLLLLGSFIRLVAEGECKASIRSSWERVDNCPNLHIRAIMEQSCEIRDFSACHFLSACCKIYFKLMYPYAIL